MDIKIDRDEFQSIGAVATKVAQEAAEKAGFTEHPDGIYFGMSDAVYHADKALSSTGLKKLVGNAPDFWWESWMNPAREENDDTPAKIFGRQLHLCVLEGLEKFKAFHAPQYHPANRKEGIAEIKEITAVGKVPVKFKDYAKILAASAFIKANTTLSNAFEGGHLYWSFDVNADYQWWSNMLDGRQMPIHEGEPQCGYFKIRDRRGLNKDLAPIKRPFIAAAIWKEPDGTFKAEIAGQPVEIDQAWPEKAA